MHLYNGETFELEGYSFKAQFERDDDIREPWNNHDGHGSCRTGRVGTNGPVKCCWCRIVPRAAITTSRRLTRSPRMMDGV